jgi:hypothetical protein
MRFILSLVLFGWTCGVYAQQDSSTLVFGYDDSTKIKVHIDLEDPLQDINAVITGGISSIGALNGNSLAVNIGYYAPFNINSSATFKLVSSFQGFSESGLLFIEGAANKNLISKVSRASMKMKLTSGKIKGSDIYYAQFPFEVRHQLVLDGGFNLQELRSDIALQSLTDSGHYLNVNNRRFINGLVGISYVRSRNVAITVDDKQSLHFLTKFKAGVNLGIFLAGGSDVVRRDHTDTLREVKDADYGNTQLTKFGVGFDLAYQYETAKPGWVVSFEILGRFIPRYIGDAYFHENVAVQKFENYKYSSPLLLMPSISIGYVLR